MSISQVTKAVLFVSMPVVGLTSSPFFKLPIDQTEADLTDTAQRRVPASRDVAVSDATDIAPPSTSSIIPIWQRPWPSLDVDRLMV